MVPVFKKVKKRLKYDIFFFINYFNNKVSYEKANNNYINIDFLLLYKYY